MGLVLVSRTLEEVGVDTGPHQCLGALEATVGERALHKLIPLEEEEEARMTSMG